MGQRSEQRLHKRRNPAASEHLKWCSTLVAIRELQIKITNTHHNISIRLAKILKADNTKCWESRGAMMTLLQE